MYAVVTGDIVNSQAAAPEEWLRALKALLRKYAPEGKCWEIYRGDSFQLELKDASVAVHAAFSIKATIMQRPGLDARMGIGLGDKTYSGNSVKESSGSGYVFSGSAFEQLKKRTLNILSPWRELDTEINLYFDLAALTTNQWTESSAEAVALAFAHPTKTQTELAKALKISQGNVSDRLKRAGYHEIKRIDARYRSLLERLETNADYRNTQLDIGGRNEASSL